MFLHGPDTILEWALAGAGATAAANVVALLAGSLGVFEAVFVLAGIQTAAINVSALNVLLEVARFRRPWSMRPFAVPGLGRIALRTLSPFGFSQVFYLQGIANRGAVPRHEVYAHYELLKRTDGGRAFLRIMRGFELTQEKQRFLWGGMAEPPYPVRIVWGERDFVFTPEFRYGWQQRLPAAEVHPLANAGHWLLEDEPVEAERILRAFLAGARTSARTR